MNKKILIFTATYNEAENIRKFIEKILELNVKLDLLVIDDNSPDETWKIVNEYKKENENIILVKRENKEGLDTAHKLAFNYAKEHNYDYLITLDADLSHDPKVIPNFIDQLEDHLLELSQPKYNIKSLNYIVDTIINDGILPVNTIGISVDDADRSFFTTAWPKFKEKGFPVTLFISTATIVKGNKNYINWD